MTAFCAAAVANALAEQRHSRAEAKQDIGAHAERMLALGLEDCKEAVVSCCKPSLVSCQSLLACAAEDVPEQAPTASCTIMAHRDCDEDAVLGKMDQPSCGTASARAKQAALLASLASYLHDGCAAMPSLPASMDKGCRSDGPPLAFSLCRGCATAMMLHAVIVRCKPAPARLCCTDSEEGQGAADTSQVHFFKARCSLQAEPLVCMCAAI